MGTMQQLACLYNEGSGKRMGPASALKDFQRPDAHLTKYCCISVPFRVNKASSECDATCLLTLKAVGALLEGFVVPLDGIPLAYSKDRTRLSVEPCKNDCAYGSSSLSFSSPHRLRAS